MQFILVLVLTTTQQYYADKVHACMKNQKASNNHLVVYVQIELMTAVKSRADL